MNSLDIQYAVVPELCTCHDKWGVPTHLADLQETYEDLLLSDGKTPGEALKIMGINRMCCRISLLNPPSYFFGYSSNARFRDETKQEENLSGSFQQLNRNRRIIVHGGADVLPNRPLPELPVIRFSDVPRVQ